MLLLLYIFLSNKDIPFRSVKGISVCCCRQVEGKVVEIARLQEIIADKVLEQVILFSTCLPVVGVRQAYTNSTAWLVAYCCRGEAGLYQHHCMASSLLL